MMKLSKALMLSVSELMFMSGGSAASIHNLTSFPGAVTFVHTHTSHPEEMLLSSLEKFNKDDLLITLTRSLRSDLSPQGRGGKGALSSSDLIRGSRWNEEANLSDLDTPIKLEYDRSTSPLRGEGQGEGDKNNLIQLAATCFVTDTSACSGNEFAGNNADDDGHGAPGGPSDGDDYDLDNEERCNKEGYYLTSCPDGQEGAGFCPYDSNYFEKCVSSCPSNYVTCEKPYYGVGEACDEKYASCEKDTERACQELNPGYVDKCGTGQQLSDDRCSYDSSYGTCCNTCAGYDTTSIPDGYVQDGEACTGCDGQEHYKIKPNPCDGFMDCGSMGGEAGAKTCLSGTTTKYDNCKACPNLGTLTSCPSPYTCTYEECSGLWYKTGCQSGYDWDKNAQTCTQQCNNECTLSSCPSPFTCRYEDCSGKYCKTGCQSGYDWDAGSQTCTEQCDYDCNLDSCPDNAECYYESCSGKYCFDNCNESYEYSNGQCICPNQGTLSSYQDCPFGHACRLEQCSGKYVDPGVCDEENGFEFNNSLNGCQCTDEPKYHHARYFIYGVEDCDGFYKESYRGCGKTLYACAEGKSAHAETGKYCEFIESRNLYWIQYENNYYHACVNENNQVIATTGGEYCEFSGYTSDQYKTLEECEEALATAPDPAIGGLRQCGEPCKGD